MFSANTGRSYKVAEKSLLFQFLRLEKFPMNSFPIPARSSLMINSSVKLLKPNDIYINIYIYVCVCVCVCRTAALTSRRYILNIYSTNIHTEYFKHAA